MAVLQKMRDKFGAAISIIIALSLLYFIAPMDDLMSLFGRPQNVGEINGKGVSYEDFAAEVDKQTDIMEIMTGSTAKDEQGQKQVRDAAWQEFINRDLFLVNAAAAGIKVGEAELVERTTGEQVSPIIAQNPIFTDNSGNFSPDAVIEFVHNSSSDETGRMQLIWKYFQNTINAQEYYAKYGALFTNSYYVNDLQKERELLYNNTSANVDYILEPYGFNTDSTLAVSTSEIKKYYAAHKSDFRQQLSRDVEYVVYEVKPSPEDIDATSAEMNAAHAEFATASEVKSFLLRNSERQLSNRWYKAGELKTVNTEIDAFVFSSGKGVSPVIKDRNTFYAVKVVDEALLPDSVYVKHILLQSEDADHLADSLLNVLKTGSDFATLAAAYSADKQSAADGSLGNIGWMTQDYMIPGFEKVITEDFSRPRKIQTAYGTHIVAVTKKTKPVAKKRVAILEKTAIPSKETFQEMYNKANTFSVMAAGTLEGFRKAADSLGVYAASLNINEGTSDYGAISDAKEVTRAAFDLKKGKTSEIITVNQNYFFVVAVKDIHKEGYASLAEVTPQISSILTFRKRQEAAKADMAAKIAGKTTLEEIATALGTEVSAGKDVTFTTTGYSELEPAVLGAMIAAKDGEISAPVAGERGVYVFKVNSREEGKAYTEDDVKSFAGRKAQYSSQMILPVMMIAADVQDNRARYF